VTIDQARRRLTRATGIPIPPSPADREWFQKALARNARKQQERILNDEHCVKIARWRRAHDPVIQQLGLPPIDPRFQSVPIAVLERQLLRSLAAVPEPLSAYYEQRLRAWARKNGIRLRWAPTVHGGSAWCRFGAVEISYPAIEELFGRGVHELAHWLTREEAKRYRTIPHPDDPSIEVSPLAEVAAWRKAKQLIGEHDWTPRMQSELRRCLSTYLRHATASERRTMETFMADGQK
jgi:hypothetical protein